MRSRESEPGRFFVVIIVCAILLLAASAATAQTLTVRGQFLLPNGDFPHETIRYSVSSGDGRTNDIRFSDSNGRFIIERLPSGRIDITISVSSDGSTYGDTSYNFIPYASPNGTADVRVTLSPLPRKPASVLTTISAASGYKPSADAVRAHEAALKEIEKQAFQAAEPHLRRAISLDPKFPAPLIDLAALLMQQRRYPEAEQLLRQALDADSKSVLGLLNLGITLNRQGKFADAIPHLREALRLEPRLVPGHLNLGIALLEDGQPEEAERALLRTVRTPGPEEAPAQLHLGRLYARSGEFSKAVTALEAYLEKAPTASNADEVRSLVARLRREMSTRR